MESVVAKCEGFKENGNKLLKEFHFSNAIESYT